MCPNCGGYELYMIGGGMVPGMACKKCGYHGPVFEKTLIDKTENKK